MTHRLDVAQRRNTVARWCALAEQRLEHLTELFETGRWRRYHSEVAFLENIREAKAAVETWRDLSSREASRDNSAIDMSWLHRPGVAARPLGKAVHDRPRWLSLAPIPEPVPRRIVVRPGEADLIASDEAPFVPAAATPDLEMPDLQTQDLETQDLQTQDLETHDLQTQDLQIHDLEAPSLAVAAELLSNIDAIERRYPLLHNAL